jgi:S1-C subfamily serine protease
MSFKILSLSAALLAAPWGLSAQPALDLGTLCKQTSPAVVVIEALGNDGKVARVGSRLHVSADGKLLTNYYVVAHNKIL